MNGYRAPYYPHGPSMGPSMSPFMGPSMEFIGPSMRPFMSQRPYYPRGNQPYNRFANRMGPNSNYGNARNNNNIYINLISDQEKQIEEQQIKIKQMEERDERRKAQIQTLKLENIKLKATVDAWITFYNEQ